MTVCTIRCAILKGDVVVQEGRSGELCTTCVERLPGKAAKVMDGDTSSRKVLEGKGWKPGRPVTLCKIRVGEKGGEGRLAGNWSDIPNFREVRCIQVYTD
jgi:hypothetical protein